MPLLACAGTPGEPDAEAETNGPFLPGPLAFASAGAPPVLPGQTKHTSVTVNLNCLVLSSEQAFCSCFAQHLTDVGDLDVARHNTVQ